MDNNQLYKEWLHKATADKELTEELEAIKGDQPAIDDRFYTDISFGTGGLRGIIGAGTNRVNIYTIARVSQGLSNYVNNHYKEEPSVAIAYDSRRNSKLFAETAAEVFAANGLRVHIYRELKPTPMLSYAVRALGCSAGVVITASHNPAEYNGYKVYNDDGCQVTLEAAKEITSHIEKLNYFEGIEQADFEQRVEAGDVLYIDQQIEDDYYKEVKACSVYPEARDSDLKVVYTPLNGAGNKPVRHILNKIGIQDVHVVPEQEHPDPAFTTCPYPNPEMPEALELGIQLAGKLAADLVIATDPDCDRVGAAVRSNGTYTLISGNQMGALLLDFICQERIRQNNMPKNPMAIKTIVTTELIQKVADDYGVRIENVLTGFKFIGEMMGKMKQKSELDQFLFGLEESYGYLTGAYARDKDAVNGSMLICEMAAYHKAQDKTLLDALDALYKKHGMYYDMLDTATYKGEQGMQDMAEIMENLRAQPPTELGGKRVIETSDYVKGIRIAQGREEKINLPQSNVMGLVLEDGSSVVVRPSGTEPKLKVYYSVLGKDLQACKQQYKKINRDLAPVLTA